ncbi:MAG: hypothetical protein KAT71_02955 [Gammaproteobacteria bacterium]|nr:hypothetical protein [Gammaproteobacteria bacterium]
MAIRSSASTIEESESDSIAIIGMAGKFPGADNLGAFWQNIKKARETISTFSDVELLAAGANLSLIQKSNYIKKRGILKNIELFDAKFFGYSPHEAAITDPQRRIFLQLAWEALENAAYTADKYNGRVGVFAGSANSS